MKPFIKAIIIFNIIVSFIIISVIASLKYADYADHKKNSNIVKSYMLENHSDIDYKLVKTNIGKNAWPTDRIADEFIYYDSGNEFYFNITCSNGNVTDYYDEAFYGLQIVVDIQKECIVNTQNCMMRGWALKTSDNQFTDICLQVVIFIDQPEIPHDAFTIYRYLKECYGNANISFVFAKDNSRDEYEALFRYENKIALSSLPHFYCCDINSQNVEITTFEDFLHYINNNNI